MFPKKNASCWIYYCAKGSALMKPTGNKGVK